MPIILSIIVPIYNAEKYIHNFMNNYDYLFEEQVEIILINDGSTDSTQKMLKKYADMNNIKIVSTEHNGSASARNLGLRLSLGEYVIFTDIDDYLNISLTLSLIEYMKEKGINILRNNFAVSDLPNSKFYVNPEINFEFTHFDDQNILIHMGFWSYIFRREVLFVNNLFFWPTLKDINSRYFVIDDWFFLLSLFNRKLLIYESNVTIYNYYVNASAEKKAHYVSQQKELLKCYFNIFRSQKLRKNFVSRNTWRYILLDIFRSIRFNIFP